MKARVKLTPELISMLERGDSLTFKITTGCDTIEVVREDEIVSFDKASGQDHREHRESLGISKQPPMCGLWGRRSDNLGIRSCSRQEEIRRRSTGRWWGGMAHNSQRNWEM